MRKTICVCGLRAGTCRSAYRMDTRIKNARELKDMALRYSEEGTCTPQEGYAARVSDWFDAL